VVQLVLPYRTAMPLDSALAPRRARPVVESPLPTYTQLLQSPIFAPDRTPGGSGAGPAGPASLEGLVVVGIAIRPGAASALVKSGDGPVTKLRPGQEIAGWRLIGVDPSHLSFVRAGERRILTLDPHKAVTGAADRTTQASADDDEDEDER
jgi:hypothetical protein